MTRRLAALLVLYRCARLGSALWLGGCAPSPAPLSAALQVQDPAGDRVPAEQQASTPLPNTPLP